MKITVGSPKPASASSRSSTPVAHSESATPMATIATGKRSHTNSATTAPRTTNVIVLSSIRRARRGRDYPGWTGEPGPSGIPIRYQATKSAIQKIERITTYGSISATTVPMPALF